MSRAGFVIRPALEIDAPYFPTIENSAGTLFEDIDELAWIAKEKDRPAAQYRDLISQGLSWTALTPAGHPAGFLAAGLEASEMHVWELAVCRDLQGRGIGKALLATAIAAVQERGLAAITLTTFSDVPWNAPFYERLGFVMLADSATPPRLRALLRDEAAQGFPIHRRGAMRLSLQSLRRSGGE